MGMLKAEAHKPTTTSNLNMSWHFEPTHMPEICSEIQKYKYMEAKFTSTNTWKNELEYLVLLLDPSLNMKT